MRAVVTGRTDVLGGDASQRKRGHVAVLEASREAIEPERCHVITCMPSYHGSTIGALGLSGDPANTAFLDGFGQNVDGFVGRCNSVSALNFFAESRFIFIKKFF